MSKSPSQHRPKVGVFPLTGMAIAAILSLRTITVAAQYGLSALTYYIIAALVFFIPTALVCLELGTRFPEAGGLYNWVQQAFGKRLAFLAIWLEWTNNVIAFPVMLAFIGFTLTYPFAHMVAENRFYEFIIVLIVLWGATLLNFTNIKASGIFSSVCVLIGAILPVIFIIILAIKWIIGGNPIHIHLTPKSLIPSFHLGSLAFLISIINGFSGIEIVAFHLQDTKSVRKVYSRVITLSITIILTISIFTTLAIAVVLPHGTINLVGGLIQAVEAFLNKFHLGWLLPVMAVLLATGAAAELNAWIIGPSRGMSTASKSLGLFRYLSRTNSRGMPTGMLIVQGVIASLLALSYLVMPDINTGYWLLSDLTGQFTLIMWLLILAGAIYLRIKGGGLSDAYYIPGGLLGMIIVAGLAICVCLVILVFSYIPPDVIVKSGAVVRYESFLIIGLLLFVLIPFIISYKVSN